MTRLPVLLVSLAAAVWLASAYPGTRAEEQARAIRPPAGGSLTPPQITRSIELLQDARRARPDGDILPRLAGLELTAGRAEQAADLVRPLVRREPENLPAWTILAFALERSGDRVGARQAQARRRELAPPVR